MGYQIFRVMQKQINIMLSIPFMGYAREVQKFEPTRRNFQFPLWDTNNNIYDNVYFAFIFQFPLWDTQEKERKQNQKGKHFQFPLWDT